MTDEPIFSCQNDYCAEEHSYHADMLAIWNGESICEACFGNCHLDIASPMTQLEKRQASAEVEITPAMIEAGVHTLAMLTISDLAAGDVTAQEASVRVYEAMVRARLLMPE